MVLEQIKTEWNGAERSEKAQTRITVKEDILLPDGKPDIARVLQTELSPCVEESSVENGRLSISGKIWVDMLYLTEGNPWTIHSMRMQLPMEAYFETECGDGTPNCVFSANTEEMRVILRSARKVNLSAMVEMNAEIVWSPKVSIVSSVEGPEELQVMETVRSISQKVAEGREKLIVKEELPLPEREGNLSELLWWDAVLCGKETQLMTGQAMVRGELEVYALYTTEESDTQVHYLRQRVPFSGVIDGEGIAPGMRCELSMSLEKPMLRIGQDEDGELRVLEMEALCECVLRVYEEQEQHWIRDLYIPSQKTERVMQEAEVAGPIRMETMPFHTDGETEIPENLPDPVQFFYVSAVPQVDDTFMENGILQVEGFFQTAVYYQTAEDSGGVCAFSVQIPFRCSMNLGMPEDIRLRTGVMVQEASAAWQGARKLRISIGCQLELTAAETQKVQTVQDIRMESMSGEELAAIPAMALYIVQPGDTLWDIAKRFNTTADRIAQINEIGAEETPEPGRCFVMIKA